MMPPDFSGVRWARRIFISPSDWRSSLRLRSYRQHIITVCSAFPGDGSVRAFGGGGYPAYRGPSRAALTSIPQRPISHCRRAESRTISRCTTSSVSRDCCREKGRYAVGQGPMWVVAATPTEPPSGRKNLALSEVFARADRLCGEGVVLAGQKRVATLDIVHGVANDNLQRFFGSRPAGHHVIGDGFQRLNQP